MKNIKRSITLLLIAAMIFSSVGTAFADTNGMKFTDISNSWAKQYIISVYNKGLMNGYTETQFKPQLIVTNYQVLIAIAKMTNAKDSYDLAALAEKYKNELKNVPYGKQEVAYCLEAGIVTSEELGAMSQYTQATKQVVSKYIAKAMGARYDANKTVTFLGFTDSEFIVKENKPYIKHLIDLGILNSSGDAMGNFNPDSFVTRDVFAKMLDVASDKYAELKSATPPTNTNPIPGTDGTTTPTTPSAPTIPTVPTTPETPTAPPVIEKPDYTGTLDQIIIEYGVIVFQIKDSKGVASKKDFKVANNIKCIIDGVESNQYWLVKPGDKAFIYTNNEGKIIKLVVDSRIKKLSGTLESMSVTDKLELGIKLQTGEVRAYYITDKTKIIKNKTAASYEYLKQGDKIAITVDDVDITDINAESTIVNDSGIIESIIYTRTAEPKITMVDKDGNKKEYFIRENLDSWNIVLEGQNSNVYDLRPGMNVKVDLENKEIVKIATVIVDAAQKFDGTLKYINPLLNAITLTQYDSVQQKEIDKLIYIDNAEIRSINLTKLSLADLKLGDKITVFGTVERDKFNASLIIVNN